jgi:hypothetical protein
MSGGGAFVSTDDGEHWLRPDSGLHSAPFAMQESGANLIAATGAGLSLSTNNGASWVKTSDSGLEAGASSFAMIDSNLFLLITSGVYRSTDFGIHWTAINNGLTGPFGEADSTDLSAFVVLGTDLFASTRCCTSLFRTTNSGGDWAPSNGGLPYDAGVGSLAAIGHNLLCGVWAADSGGAGVYRSTNHGESWVLITDGLPPGHQFDQVIPCGEVTLGVMDGNLYRSLNEGASWTLIDSGEHITELVIKGTSVFAGRVECGVWRRPLSEMISTNAVASTPSAHSSITAFPNPLTQSTTITFTSPESGVAHVTIVNLLGEEVARLFDGELPDAGTGERHFPWDARGVAPGIYWCEVRMNGRVEQAAMVLEK